MTWRERTIAARERGKFLAEEIILAENAPTCACGELADRFGVDLLKLGTSSWKDGAASGTLWGYFPFYVRKNEFGLAERLLDAAEDRALELKRGAP